MELMEYVQLCAQFAMEIYRAEKVTIHQLTTMLATFKNVLFPGHNHAPGNHWCRWTDTLIITQAPARVIIKVLGHQHWWLAAGITTI